MKHLRDRWVQEWCDANGWTDLVIERNNLYWAFPPGAYMPEPISPATLRAIKHQNGLCPQERILAIAAAVTAVCGAFSTYFLQSPLPLVVAFAFGAIAAAKLEVEEF